MVLNIWLECGIHFNPHDQTVGMEDAVHQWAKDLGTIAGSAAVLKDEHYLYAFGAVEPTT
ncbi:MAG: hypothetical protein IPP15_23195 [Saprospiraceae bacterium]|uniref:Uncharacterized protein n=1 Tax=Candidatus Opimibacter skivensis TaxID=2982028 RepID=A0A9D7T2N6_9BACT|nr:hypothetical protein [Candidatus Opimibacter skivensis]